MRPIHARLWCAAILASSPLTSSAVAVTPVPAGVPGQQMIERLDDGVWVARQSDGWWQVVSGNSLIVEQADGLVLFDTGSSGDGARLVSLIQSVSDKPVKAAVISHWHGDHFFASPRLREKWPDMKIIALAATAELMRTNAARFAPLEPSAKEDEARRKRLEGTIKQLEEEAALPSTSAEDRAGLAREIALIKARLPDIHDTYIIMPTETFESRLLLDDPDRPIELRYAGRGNTAGDTVAWLPKQRILATGDAVIAPGPYAFNVSSADWIESLKRFKQIPFRTLIPGHGAPQHDTAYLDTMIAGMEEVRAEVAKLQKQGLSLDAVTKQARFDEQVKGFTKGDPYGEKVLRGYWIEPLISSAYREAKGESVLEGR